jgi:hypothetical protein
MPPKDWCDPAKETFWRAEIEKCSKTELSGREYCRRHRLSYSKFHNWKRRLQKVGERGPAEPPASAPNLNWVRIIREAKSHPRGVQRYCREHGIDYRTYLKQVWDVDVRWKRIKEEAHERSIDCVYGATEEQMKDQQTKESRDREIEKSWRKILYDCTVSGQSAAAFCRNRRIAYKTFMKWRKKMRLRKEEVERKTAELQQQHRDKIQARMRANEPSPAFAQVLLTGTKTEDPGAAEHFETGQSDKRVIDIVYQDGLMLRVGADCPVDFLCAVVSALGERNV